MSVAVEKDYTPLETVPPNVVQYFNLNAIITCSFIHVSQNLSKFCFSAVLHLSSPLQIPAVAVMTLLNTKPQQPRVKCPNLRADLRLPMLPAFSAAVCPCSGPPHWVSPHNTSKHSFTVCGAEILSTQCTCAVAVLIQGHSHK